MAGIWGRNDDTRGVHKAPANEVVRGAIALETQITQAEHDLLNPQGINCIRAFPGRGIRVWGARTLSSDPAWRYLNVRRLFNYIEESILDGTQWVVFEPNDLDLWQRIRRTISAFLLRVWRDGALFGATPEEAFFVKCDAETNPPDDGRRRPRHRARSASRRSSRRSSSSSGSPSSRAAPELSRVEGGSSMPHRRETHLPAIRSASRSTVSSIAQFKEVSGLSAEIQVIEHRENKVEGPAGAEEAAGRQKFGDITLKRGKTDNKALWDWHQAGAGRRHRRRPQERLGRPLRLRARRDRPVQLHQRVAVEGQHRRAAGRRQRRAGRGVHDHARGLEPA